jgi:HicB family
MLRMPQSLHAELARAAKQEDVSLNRYITDTLASAMGRHTDGDQPYTAPRWLPRAIRVSMVVTVAAAILAIVLLVLAWQSGG